MSKLITNTIRHTGASVDALTFDNAGNTLIADSEELQIGTGGDLQIYHSGTNSLIQNSTGYLGIQSDTLYLQDKTNGHAYITCVADGAVGLRYDNATACETSSTGLDIASGKGITFGNSGSNGQGGATLLDDYEEGVYTPTWSGGVTNKSNYAEFTFVKVGNLVHLSGAFCCNTTTNSSSDNPKFTLPFTAGNNSTNAYNGAAGALRVRNIDYATGFFVSNIDGASAYCNFYYGNDDGDWVLLRSSDVSANDELTICITYRCA